jgi:hypothetical protein
MKKFPLAGCCGISCGLCPRFQSKAKSRCLGCGPDGHCSYCPVYRCCVTKRGYESCADCREFPCERFSTWFCADSFVTHENCLENIRTIQKYGMGKFLGEQAERKEILEIMLDKYNPGQCMSLYCLASPLMDIESLKKGLRHIEGVGDNKPRVFKALIQDLARKEKVSLKLRR